ncbi:hypothetical protein JCM11641_007278 [Rhodosporidiobolus odoratus]
MLKSPSARKLPHGVFQSTHRGLTSTSISPLKTTLKLAVASGVVGALLYTQLFSQPLQQEQASAQGYEGVAAAGSGNEVKDAKVFLWGRNTHSVAAPSSTSSAAVKRPLSSAHLSNLVLRHLALSATYGCAVDSQGDVLQWGRGYGGGDGTVEKTIAGKDFVLVRPTEQGKVFGLTRSGQVYVWPSDKLRQQSSAASPAQPVKSEASWAMTLLGKGLIWGRQDDGAGTHVLHVGADSKFAKGEKFVSLSTGASHLLALTSTGRSFALPLSLAANAHGQLGVRSVTLLAPPHPGSSATSGLSVRLEPDERLNETGRSPAPPKRLDPLLLPAVPAPSLAEPSPRGDLVVSPPSSLTLPTSMAISLHPSPEQHLALERSPQFCTTLHEIPALKGVQVAELAAGKNHSLARLGGAMEGRVLGWGANVFGQLGLGASLTYPSIPTPTEIPLSNSPSYSLGGSSNRPVSVKCDRIAAGGNVSYFVVSASNAAALAGVGGKKETQDLLASGQGQYGGIGNGLWAHATSPIRVKTVSGLSEWNDHAGRVEAIKIRDVQAGEGHVAVVLDNAIAHPSGVTFGRDVLVWGQNEHYQLGTGKRSNLAIPQHLAPLPYTGEDLSRGAVEASRGASPDPSARMQLAATLPLSPTLLALNRGLGRKAIVEEAIVAGDGGTGVYWRVVNP